jgi:hypothetical protein
LQVVLTNVPEQHSATVQGATLPGRPESSSYGLPFSRVVYIEATDFRLQDSKDYYGLAPGKSAMLRYAFACAAVSSQLTALHFCASLLCQVDLVSICGTRSEAAVLFYSR